jgi:hypothetical protein
MKITYTHRSPNTVMGRFGGGWQYHIGIQLFGNFKEIIIFLFICYIRISFNK